MRGIAINFRRGLIPYVGSAKNMDGVEYKCQAIEVDSSSKQRVYLMLWDDYLHNGVPIRVATVAKQMRFEDDRVLVSFGKDKVQIGTYSETNTGHGRY